VKPSGGGGKTEKRNVKEMGTRGEQKDRPRYFVGKGVSAFSAAGRGGGGDLKRIRRMYMNKAALVWEIAAIQKRGAGTCLTAHVKKTGGQMRAEEKLELSNWDSRHSQKARQKKGGLLFPGRITHRDEEKTGEEKSRYLVCGHVIQTGE